MHRFLVLLIAAAALAFVASTPASAGLFSTPEPELIYTGSGPGLAEGILVIRDEEAFKEATTGIDPGFGGAVPDLKKVSVLRIVGRERETRCRDTALIEVSTKNRTATVKLEERVPDKNCPCAADARPPKVFFVTVAHFVKKAEMDKTDRVIPCPEAEVEKQKAESKPVLLFEGSWNGEPGAKLIADPVEYKDVLKKLGIGDRGPVVDFEKDRVVAVTGRPRENGCRRSRVTATGIANKEEAVFEIEEVYAQKGQACTQIFMQPVLLLYRVPATVMRARLTTKEVR